MRDYDPTTGRYIQADPMGLVDGASVYGYVRQTPGRFLCVIGTGMGQIDSLEQITTARSGRRGLAAELAPQPVLNVVAAGEGAAPPDIPSAFLALT